MILLHEAANHLGSIDLHHCATFKQCQVMRR